MLSTSFLDLLCATHFIFFQGNILWTLLHIPPIVKWFPPGVIEHSFSLPKKHFLALRSFQFNPDKWITGIILYQLKSRSCWWLLQGKRGNSFHPQNFLFSIPPFDINLWFQGSVLDRCFLGFTCISFPFNRRWLTATSNSEEQFKKMLLNCRG